MVNVVLPNEIYIKALEDELDYQLFNEIEERYLSLLSKKDINDIGSELSDDQHTIIASSFLFTQVNNGGFIQLIFNGYGEYVLNQNYVDMLQEYGLLKLANLVRKASELFEINKDSINNTSVEDFSNLYEELPEFDLLDDEFYKIQGEELRMLHKYLIDNIEKFVQLI